MKLQYVLTGVVMAALSLQASAVRFHCEKDTAEVVAVVRQLADVEGRGARVASAAEALVGRPADAAYYQDSTYTVSVNLDEFTPISFVNTALALAETAEHPSGGWRAYTKNFTNYSCRKGEDEGFSSIFYHTSDWLGDNIYRGNLNELTENGDARSMTASLDYLSANRDKFAALKNEDVYERVRMHEMGFRSHKIPYLPKQAVGNKDFAANVKDGDIIILVTTKDRTDYYDLGIVKMEEDGPHLIHFDQKKGMVVKEADTLKRYFNLNTKYFSGFRLARGK